MNYRELTKEIQSRVPGIHIKQIEAVFSSLTAIIKESIAGDPEVRILKLGKFKAKQTKPVTKRNPKTGEQIQVPSRSKIMFHPAHEITTHCKAGYCSGKQT